MPAHPPPHRLISRSTFARLSALSVFMALAPGAGAAPVCLGNCSIANDLSVGTFGRGPGRYEQTAGDVIVAPGFGMFGAFGAGQGTGLVTGAGSRLAIGGGNNSQLFVGVDQGTGVLTIERGGQVSVDAFPNPAGFGDARAYIGSGGDGRINVTTGGTLLVRDRGPFGAEDGIQLGRSTASGAGRGVLSVDGGSVLVDGNYAFVNVGQANTPFSSTSAGHGLLEVRGGGVVRVGGTTGGFMLVGRGGNSDGQVAVSGAGSLLDITGSFASLFVATDASAINNRADGRGRLHVTDGGRVTVVDNGGSGSLTIGRGLGQGEVLVDQGGRLQVGGVVFVSQNSPTNTVQAARLTVNDTAIVQAPNVVVGSGTATGGQINGTLAGTGMVIGNVQVRNGGEISPGNSPGTLTVDGDVRFGSGSTMRIEVGGLQAGDYDVLKVLGDVSFANALLSFEFIDGFVPMAGDSIDFLAAENITGLLSASVRYGGLAAGFRFDLTSIDGKLRFTALNDAVALPLPGTAALALLSLALMPTVGRRGARLSRRTPRPAPTARTHTAAAPSPG